jgi:hypothetical protein
MHYTQAVLKFQLECMKRNILVSFSLLKSSLVTQGRNLCVAEFLKSEIINTLICYLLILILILTSETYLKC